MIYSKFNVYRTWHKSPLVEFSAQPFSLSKQEIASLRSFSPVCRLSTSRRSDYTAHAIFHRNSEQSKSDKDAKKYRSCVESFTPWQMPVLVVGSYLLSPGSLPPFPPGSSDDARFWRSTISSEDICRDARRRIAERGPVVSAMQINTCAQYNSSQAVKVIRRRCINWHDGA